VLPRCYASRGIVGESQEKDVNNQNQRAVQAQITLPLSVQAVAFNRVTTALEQCGREARKGGPDDAGQRSERHVRLRDAVQQNSRLWFTILDELLSPENRLPPDMKQRLASLGATSLTHGGKVLAGQASLQLLIDINRTILSGLSQMRDGVRHQLGSDDKGVAYVGHQA
jgi:flagellar protein FlaF